MKITDEAVTAAALAMFADEHCDKRQMQDVPGNWDSRLNDDDQALYRSMARAALEAALPHLESRRQAMRAVTGVLGEVHAERQRQNAKWGEQNHPDGTGGNWVAIFKHPFTHCATIAKLQVDHEATIGRSNYTSILLEEVFEALSETDTAKLRAELIQVAAVAAQWVEAIDRRAS